MIKRGWSGLVVGVDWCRFQKEQTGIIVSEKGNMCETSDDTITKVKIECDYWDSKTGRTCDIVFRQKGTNLTGLTKIYQDAGAYEEWTVDGKSFVFPFCTSFDEVIKGIQICYRINGGECTNISLVDDKTFKIDGLDELRDGLNKLREKYDKTDKHDINVINSNTKYTLRVTVQSNGVSIDVDFTRLKATDKEHKVKEDVICSSCEITINDSDFYEIKYNGDSKGADSKTYSFEMEEESTCDGQLVTFTYQVEEIEGTTEYREYELKIVGAIATMKKDAKTTTYYYICDDVEPYNTVEEEETINDEINVTIVPSSPFYIDKNNGNTYTLRINEEDFNEGMKLEITITAEDSSDDECCNQETKTITIDLPK